MTSMVETVDWDDSQGQVVKRAKDLLWDEERDNPPPVEATYVQVFYRHDCPAPCAYRGERVVFSTTADPDTGEWTLDTPTCVDTGVDLMKDTVVVE